MFGTLGVGRPISVLQPVVTRTVFNVGGVEKGAGGSIGSGAWKYLGGEEGGGQLHGVVG